MCRQLPCLPAHMVLLLFAVIGHAVLDPLHDRGWCLFPLQAPFHVVHIGGDVLEESEVSAAEVIVSLFSGSGGGEAVSWAFSVAGEEEFAFLALAGQQITLVVAEAELFLAVHHLYETAFLDIAQFEFGKDEMVACIDISVELHGACMAAGLRHAAERRGNSHPSGQCGVEHLDEIFSDIVAYPFVEDGAEEIPVFLGCDREVREFSNGAVNGGGQQTAVRMAVGAFHDRSELNETAAYFLEEMIEVKRVFGCEIIDDRHGIPFHAVAVQQFDAVHDLPPGRASGARPSVFVVKFLRSVNGKSYQKIVFLEKLRPFFSNQRAVGLYGIVYASSVGVFSLQFQCAFVEGNGTHQRFSSVPGEKDGRSGLHADVFFGVAFQQFVAHDVLGLLAVHFGFFRVITVLAGQVAKCAGRFGHHIDIACKWGSRIVGCCRGIVLFHRYRIGCWFALVGGACCCMLDSFKEDSSSGSAEDVSSAALWAGM